MVRPGLSPSVVTTDDVILRHGMSKTSSVMLPQESFVIAESYSYS